ncbi:DUF309 domain-containing protein [Paenibacillus larvae]|uniref:DUF309 domain-containing protein n=1 Tax=Paenibacillus larvae subsp. larvae DSM 25430 TaxID=697284 RepID=V9W9X6_9BACL|nr:DUF309 domain-containing protein [Paenibacillus larvae]AHD06515.1 hypothetical protein ERIC2_c27300 [Paenibacillus larvae subsp. larvae DSM 25430]MCY9751473.1 DUF309 domain-containing protein [Paenibacillus larvae]MCY9771957.1 DUF309 domain-containing protein [Paenibacillus larvae]MDR5568947.1 DUF309 domain-containing protein [Paenibacillus larvae]MDR5596776.1 DUF309 domain-containing protein [Paenibacillus larvae]
MGEVTDYSGAYINFLIHFHTDRDYFECHEILEEYWKAHPEHPLSRSFVLLIQIAVAQYHERRGNRRGALKMLQSADMYFHPEQISELGLDPERLREELEERKKDLARDGRPFTDLNLPIRDPALSLLCQESCRSSGLQWGVLSDIQNDELVHRHTRRDRSSVIEERRLQKERKENQRRSTLEPRTDG